MPAPSGNKNAAKDAADRSQAKTYVYSTKNERIAWRNKAAKLGKSLSDWTKENNNAALR